METEWSDDFETITAEQLLLAKFISVMEVIEFRKQNWKADQKNEKFHNKTTRRHMPEKTQQPTTHRKQENWTKI